MNMDYQNFEVEIHNRIAQVRFNRPNKANALNQASWAEMPNLFQALSDNPEVRVVVLSGNGKHFCAGIDVQFFASINPAHIKDEARKRESVYHTILWLQRAVNAIEACRKPVIAAINGGCIGAGLDIAAACDFRLCSAEAYFVLKEIDLGMVADLGSLQRLPKIMPDGMVRQMAYTGEPLGAAEAHRLGLVNQVYPEASDLKEQAFQMAWKIAEKSPLAIRGTKQVLNHAREHRVMDSLDYVATWNAATILGNDLMKAVQASFTKQTPEFED